MIVLLVPLMLAVALAVTALGGPRLLRAAAPALMRIPRTAVALLLSAAMLWLLAAAAVSLMSAWLITGPDILPASLAGVCERHSPPKGQPGFGWQFTTSPVGEPRRTSASGVPSPDSITRCGACWALSTTGGAT